MLLIVQSVIVVLQPSNTSSVCPLSLQSKLSERWRSSLAKVFDQPLTGACFKCIDLHAPCIQGKRWKIKIWLPNLSLWHPWQDNEAVYNVDQECCIYWQRALRCVSKEDNQMGHPHRQKWACICLWQASSTAIAEDLAFILSNCEFSQQCVVYNLALLEQNTQRGKSAEISCQSNRAAERNIGCWTAHMVA